MHSFWTIFRFPYIRHFKVYTHSDVFVYSFQYHSVWRNRWIFTFLGMAARCTFWWAAPVWQPSHTTVGRLPLRRAGAGSERAKCAFLKDTSSVNEIKYEISYFSGFSLSPFWFQPVCSSVANLIVIKIEWNHQQNINCYYEESKTFFLFLLCEFFFFVWKNSF